MFSTLSSLFKIKKKSKEDGKFSRKNSQVSIGKDVLEVLDNRHTESDPEGSIVSIESKSKSQSFIKEKLLQGASDSKSAKSNSRSDATTDNNKPKLYPDLNSLSSGGESSKKVVVVDEKIKSIHDIVEEIHCIIIPKILNAVIMRRNLKLLKNETSNKIIAVQNTIINPTKYDYDFNVENEVVDNSRSSMSESKKYLTIKNFDDLKMFDQKFDKKIKIFIQLMTKKDLTKKPIFKNYSKSLKSYRGDKRDVVNCP